MKMIRFEGLECVRKGKVTDLRKGSSGASIVFIGVERIESVCEVLGVPWEMAEIALNNGTVFLVRGNATEHVIVIEHMTAIDEVVK